MESQTTGVVSVVVPCFNEQETIAEVADAVLASDLVGELIVVDDGSTDATAKILGELDDPRVRILTHETNRGKGAALRPRVRRSHPAVRGRAGRRPGVRPA